MTKKIKALHHNRHLILQVSHTTPTQPINTEIPEEPAMWVPIKDKELVVGETINMILISGLRDLPNRTMGFTLGQVQSKRKEEAQDI